jgi:hypothetical protein
MRTAVPPAGSRILIVGSGEHPSYAELEQQLLSGGCNVTRQIIPSPGSWGEVDNFGSALIPQAIIRAVVAYLAEEKN